MPADCCVGHITCTNSPDFHNSWPALLLPLFLQLKQYPVANSTVIKWHLWHSNPHNQGLAKLWASRMFHARWLGSHKGDFPGSAYADIPSYFTFLGFFLCKIQFEETRTLKCFLLNKMKILNPQIYPKLFLLLFNRFILMQHEICVSGADWESLWLSQMYEKNEGSKVAY